MAMHTNLMIYIVKEEPMNPTKLHIIHTIFSRFGNQVIKAVSDNNFHWLFISFRDRFRFNKWRYFAFLHRVFRLSFIYSKKAFHKQRQLNPIFPWLEYEHHHQQTQKQCNLYLNMNIKTLASPCTPSPKEQYDQTPSLTSSISFHLWSVWREEALRPLWVQSTVHPCKQFKDKKENIE